MSEPLEFDMTQLKKDLENEQRATEKAAEQAKLHKEELAKARAQENHIIKTLSKVGSKKSNLNALTIRSVTPILPEENYNEPLYTSKEVIELSKLPFISKKSTKGRKPGSKNKESKTQLLSYDYREPDLNMKMVENGSLVVLTTKDPKAPTKTMLQTYLATPEGHLKAVALSDELLSVVMDRLSPYTRAQISNKALTGSIDLTKDDEGTAFKSPILLPKTSSVEASPIHLSLLNRSNVIQPVGSVTTPEILDNKRKRTASYSITSL